MGIYKDIVDKKATIAVRAGGSALRLQPILQVLGFMCP